ncbi:hypothetical protein GOP47_0016623 [Adiantum capillus-veneris]|uniref:Uncharacterized protein n=1 Tax=Adiantum capillus-veneris TaxID=13818 RepID=A0A9D4UI10_ADICA|nr:hypothetical protein GOP47_0016623 [Adiantum capillus-veneris]
MSKPGDEFGVVKLTNNWICAESMVHSGLCMLPMGLASQPATDACLEDDSFQHVISRTKHDSMASECCNLSEVSHDVAWQERQNIGFTDFGRSGSKGSFSRESSRSSFWSPYSSTLSVVSEDKPWDSSSSMYDSRLQDERSSLSSLSSSEESSSSCSLEDVSEVQSSYKGPLANMYALEEALPRKRGLSGFFAGKSRSFSCLADVTSVEELAKPENPYTKKRKYISACIGNSDRLHTRPLRTGAVGISKKNFHRYTPAFSGVVSAKGAGSQFSPDE